MKGAASAPLSHIFDRRTGSSPLLLCQLRRWEKGIEGWLQKEPREEAILRESRADWKHCHCQW